MKKTLKIFICVLLISLIATPVFAKSSSHSTSVHGYTKKLGTKVQAYHRTVKDSTVKNNYVYKGNLNPYTKKVGTRTYTHKK